MLTQAEVNRIARQMWKQYDYFKKLGCVPIKKAKIRYTIKKLQKRVIN